MTTLLPDLHELLCGLSVGQSCTLPYNIYELLFPPGEPDQGARAGAYGFASDHGCVIDNRPTSSEVVFTRKITNPACCVHRACKQLP